MNVADLIYPDGEVETFTGVDLRVGHVGCGVVEIASRLPVGTYVTIAYVCLAPGQRLELRRDLTQP